ncbi:hypothetical protein V8C86DRAFT_2430566 [Haematococcus lacustris]
MARRAPGSATHCNLAALNHGSVSLLSSQQPAAPLPSPHPPTLTVEGGRVAQCGLAPCWVTLRRRKGPRAQPAMDAYPDLTVDSRSPSPSALHRLPLAPPSPPHSLASSQTPSSASWNAQCWPCSPDRHEATQGQAPELRSSPHPATPPRRPTLTVPGEWRWAAWVCSLGLGFGLPPHGQETRWRGDTAEL